MQLSLRRLLARFTTDWYTRKIPPLVITTSIILVMISLYAGNNIIIP